MSKPYYSLKKEYYINLRSDDANIIQTPAGSNYKFIWRINNINVSRNAKMCLHKLVNAFGGAEPYIIRCPQVKNSGIHDSAGADPIIYMNGTLTSPINEAYFNLSTQNIDTIELLFSNSITVKNNGIDGTIDFYIQLKIIDFDEEPVDPEIMPTFTRSSLSYHYNTPIN